MHTVALDILLRSRAAAPSFRHDAGDEFDEERAILNLGLCGRLATTLWIVGALAVLGAVIALMHRERRAAVVLGIAGVVGAVGGVLTC
jgi:hypothetical protein